MKRLSWYDYITVNIFWLGLNIRNSAMGSAFLPYLVAGFVSGDIKNSALGGLRTAGLIIAMVVQPWAGLLSDRSTSRFGRRRPFIFVGVLLDLVFLAAVYLSGTFWILLAATLFQQFSANISHGPLQGLIPDLVPEDERGRASAVKAIFELLPLVLIAMVIAPMVGKGQIGLAVVVTGALLLGTMLLTMACVKEEPLKTKPATPMMESMVRVLGVLFGILVGAVAGLLAGGLVGGACWWIAGLFASAGAAQAIGIGTGGMVAMAVAVVAGVNVGARNTLEEYNSKEASFTGVILRMVFVEWLGGTIKLVRRLVTRQPVWEGANARQNSSFTWWVVNRLFFLAAMTSIQGFAAYFVMYAFTLTREAAVALTGQLILVVGICTMISALPGGWLADRFGRKRLVGISGIIAAVGAFMLLLTIWVPNLPLLYVIGAILGLGTGLFMTTNWALGTDLVPAAQAGRYLGISNLAGAGAGMIGSGIGGVVADRLEAVTPGLGYFAIFAAYGVLFLLSTLTLSRIQQAPVSVQPVE